MGRIIHTGDTPAKRRNLHRRTCAELIRMLAQRPAYDDEARDMAALFVFALRGIYETIESSANTWDDRNYWKRAEKLRRDWRWSARAADRMESAIRADAWDDVSDELVTLIPHFKDINVATITRNSDWWCGALRALVAEQP